MLIYWYTLSRYSQRNWTKTIDYFVHLFCFEEHFFKPFPTVYAFITVFWICSTSIKSQTLKWLFLICNQFVHQLQHLRNLTFFYEILSYSNRHLSSMFIWHIHLQPLQFFRISRYAINFIFYYTFVFKFTSQISNSTTAPFYQSVINFFKPQ